jgi:hypothetical protein
MNSPNSGRHGIDHHSSNEHERRINERICVNLPLILNLATDTGMFEEKALSRDISSSGAYCYFKYMLKIGDFVDLQIAPRFRNCPGSLFPSLINAEVIRIDAFSGFGMHGTALRFNCEIPSMKAHRS